MMKLIMAHLLGVVVVIMEKVNHLVHGHLFPLKRKNQSLVGIMKKMTNVLVIMMMELLFGVIQLVKEKYLTGNQKLPNNKQIVPTAK